MAIDYEKLMQLDYTAYEHAQDFQENLDKKNINYPKIEVATAYDDGVPRVDVVAEDPVESLVYIDSYFLEDVTMEESKEVMFDVWKLCVKQSPKGRYNGYPRLYSPIH